MPPSCRILLSALIFSTLIPAPGVAQEPGFFAGLDVSAGIAQGSSDTRDGGASFAGGGIVDGVKFGNTTGIGGHAGYRLDPSWSLFLSYQYARGDVRWRAAFPAIGAASRFSGTAYSHTVLANVGYEKPLTSTVTLQASAGLGVAFNALADVVEKDEATSAFLSDVAKHTRANPAARIGLGLRYAVAKHATIGLDAAITYIGGFRTGDTRSGNLGVTPITPYDIDGVWRTSLSASAGMRF
jgi:hypothetical protein